MEVESADGFRGFAVIDVETNSLSSDWGRVLEVACVDLRPDMSLESTWDTLVNPDTTRVGRTDIHHIHSEDLTSAPAFAALTGDLVDHLRGRILVAHNIGFDCGFLSAEFERAGVHFCFSDVPGLDTLDLARQRWPGERASLDACCERVNIPRPAAHSALADALATATLLRHLVDLRDPSTMSTLQQAERKAGEVVWPCLPVCHTEVLSRQV